MSAPYSPAAAANFFLKTGLEKDVPLTQMKLHKLLYYAHGWHLALIEKPLLNEMVEAWEYGPVVPSIYHEFKDLGSKPISRLATDLALGERDDEGLASFFFHEPSIAATDPFVPALLKRIWEVYGKFSAAQLSRMTHAADSPWTEARKANPGIRGVDIPNDCIRSFFKERLTGATA